MEESWNPEELLSRYMAVLSQDPDYRQRASMYEVNSRNDPDSALENMQRFIRSVFAGVLPPPSVLIFIANAFQKYLAQEGKKKGNLSLDESFGLLSERKSGNPARQKITRQARLGLMVDMAFIRAASEISIAKAARLALQYASNKTTSAEALRKAYGKWNYKEVEEQLKRGSEMQ